MQTKQFDHTIRFSEVRTNTGETISFPIVMIDLIQNGGNRVTLPLLFDTGASITTLRHELYPLLDLPSWDVGQPAWAQTAGGQNPVRAYRYEVTIEFLGKTIQCPVNLQELPPNDLFVGLFGRDQVFHEFGFGYWENVQELYVTVNP